MSDLSLSDQSFALPSVGSLPVLRLPELAPESTDVRPHEITFRQLKGAHEVARILHLRDEIQLSSTVRGDAAFMTREKKETRSVW